MSQSPDLLRDAEVLRKLLTECLRRVDRLERQLSVEAPTHNDEAKAQPLTDPFEQVLPDAGQDSNTQIESPLGSRPRPHMPSSSNPGIRTPHGAPGRRLKPDELLRPCTEPKTPRTPNTQPSRSADAGPPSTSGDGMLDPFALLDVSVSPPEPLDAEIRRGMDLLLDGLDVSTPNGE